MGESVVEILRNIIKIGHTQYDSFIEQCLINATIPITERLPRQQLLLFSSYLPKVKSSVKLKGAALQLDRDIMSRLYLSCMTRAVNLDDFFQH